jgi:3-phosphoshikimate 1-carboxyvinyltransferase
MKKQKLRDVRSLTGEITVPGDKSISHRALLLAALARGSSRVQGMNVGADVLATVRALRHLGVACRVADANREVEIEGNGWAGLHEPDDIIDAGNSGTTIRTLAGVCAGVAGLTVLTGDAAVRRRPMLRVVAPLRQMGATIDGRAHGDRPPLAIRGGPLSGIDLDMTVASAQVKTAILIAGLHASGSTSVTEPAPSRDHTERMLAAAGVPLHRDERTVTVEGGQDLIAMEWIIPGDLSAAMFLLVGALLVDGSDLAVKGVGINGTRSGALDVLARMGARLDVEPQGEHGGEPVGLIHGRTSELHGTHVTPDEVPSLIDEIPVLAVAATQATGETVIAGAEELRYKESDRIAAIVAALQAVGGDADELPDGLVVRGPTPLTGGEVDARGDHRIAMALAIAGLVAHGRVSVKGWGSVQTSFPEFLDVLGRAQGR